MPPQAEHLVVATEPDEKSSSTTVATANRKTMGATTTPEPTRQLGTRPVKRTTTKTKNKGKRTTASPAAATTTATSEPAAARSAVAPDHAPAAEADARADPGAGKAEVRAACDFLSSLLTQQLGPPAAARAMTRLEAALVARYTGHWFPADPERGSGFRCISSMPGKPDALIQAALAAELGSNAAVAAAVELLPGAGSFSIWVDPGFVGMKVGDGHALTPLYGSTGGPAQARRPRSPSPPRSQRSLSPNATSFSPTAAKAAPSPPRRMVDRQFQLREFQQQLHQGQHPGYTRFGWHAPTALVPPVASN